MTDRTKRYSEFTFAFRQCVGSWEDEVGQ